MNQDHSIYLIILFLLEIIVSIRVLLRSNRQPASRIAWIVVIHLFPLGGMLAYLLVGEVSIGILRKPRLKRITQYLQKFPQPVTTAQNCIPAIYLPLFKLGESISGFTPVNANSAQLLADSDTFIQQLLKDIQQATQHIDMLFYIWLPDTNGSKVAQALQQAAQRGVTCRVLVDNFGSKLLIRSPFWQAMRQSGVTLNVALPIRNFLLVPLTGRIDLRNHRKIIVIDQVITYCGSQNCADPAFKIKARYAPWVDIMVRFTGPIAAQNQLLFANDWLLNSKQLLTNPIDIPLLLPNVTSNTIAQVIGTGPTIRASAISELFTLLISLARETLFITTPYYVPDDSMHNALCTAAYRGVAVTVILPARNDSWIVSAASRSYYMSLLEAGVKLYEYKAGLLHAKTLTLDNAITLIGSANLDRRSFDLNYENNMLVYSYQLTASIKQRQQSYLADSQAVTLPEVKAWSKPKQLWNNTIAMLGPVL